MPRHTPRPLADACEALLVGALLCFFRILPFRAALAAGRGVGALLGALDRGHRHLAERQLEEAGFPPEEASRLARGLYAHLGICVAELAWVERRVAEKAVGEWVRIEGLDHVHAALAKGKGLGLVAGHLGNWELGAVAMGAAGVPLSLVVRPLDNPRLDARLVALRRAGGSEVIQKRNALRAIREVLSRGRGVVMLIDQDAREHGVFVDFFGRPASTIPSIAAIALRTGAPLLVTAMRREPGNLTHVLSFDPVEPPPSTGDGKEDARRLTAMLTARLEARIRQAPEQWLWMHRRWKTRPL
jgi:KDO2-lipid IV(A) lauroyltransferase